MCISALCLSFSFSPTLIIWGIFNSNVFDSFKQYENRFIYRYVFPVTAAPNPPVDVKITSCGDWKLGLTWTAGFNNFLPIIDYTVEYSTSFKPKEWVYLSKTTNNNTFISGISLSAWVEYTFRIKAMNSKGFSVPSEPTNICKTDPKKPSRHPEGVKIKNSQEGYLSIEWEVIIFTCN